MTTSTISTLQIVSVLDFDLEANTFCGLVIINQDGEGGVGVRYQGAMPPSASRMVLYRAFIDTATRTVLDWLGEPPTCVSQPTFDSSTLAESDVPRIATLFQTELATTLLRLKTRVPTAQILFDFATSTKIEILKQKTLNGEDVCRLRGLFDMLYMVAHPENWKTYTAAWRIIGRNAKKYSIQTLQKLIKTPLHALFPLETSPILLQNVDFTQCPPTSALFSLVNVQPVWRTLRTYAAHADTTPAQAAHLVSEAYGAEMLKLLQTTHHAVLFPPAASAATLFELLFSNHATQRQPLQIRPDVNSGPLTASVVEDTTARRNCYAASPGITARGGILWLVPNVANAVKFAQAPRAGASTDFRTGYAFSESAGLVFANSLHTASTFQDDVPLVDCTVGLAPAARNEMLPLAGLTFMYQVPADCAHHLFKRHSVQNIGIVGTCWNADTLKCALQLLIQASEEQSQHQPRVILKDMSKLTLHRILQI